MRKFKKITEYDHKDFPLPKRATSGSAGYDFVCVKDTLVPGWITTFLKLAPSIIDEFEISELYQIQAYLESGLVDEARLMFEDKMSISSSHAKTIIAGNDARLALVPTGVKAYMEEDEALKIYVRSSTPRNLHIMLANGTGLIDSDYVDNPGNEGHIMFQLINLSPYDIVIKEGDVIGQGVFIKYLKTDDDNGVSNSRIGGFGSSGQ